MTQTTQRLDKLLCHAKGLSRSEVKKGLHQGWAEVNGVVSKKGDIKVRSTDLVLWQGVRVEPLGSQYLMLNKPVGYEVTRVSQHHATVFDLLAELPSLDRIQPVGRLDVETSGLLFLTDDGQWAHRLMSPRHHQPKVYLAELAEPLVEGAEQRLAEGLWLKHEKEKTRPASLERLSPTRIRLTVTEGRYHQVRRMLAALNNRVLSLHREAIGGLVLDETQLPAGSWRSLSADEVADLGSA